MINIVEGHTYRVENFEDKDTYQVVQFIHKIPDVDAGNGVLVTFKDGTTNEELLKVLIDRMKYLQNKFPCTENAMVIPKLEESLMWLNKRTADRIARNVEGKQLK